MNQHVRPPIDHQEKTNAYSAPQKVARAATLINPRFYTTNFEKLDSIDVSVLYEEWDTLLVQLRADPSKTRTPLTDKWESKDLETLPENLRAEFADFLIYSLTAEFSGCVLYKELKRQCKNLDLRELFGYMNRDEARHAGLITEALKALGIEINLGFSTKAKKYTLFQPKFIIYASYLSKIMCYARNISIFRQFEKKPERRFHPIFKLYEEWGNDEFLHAEALSLLMRAEPKLVSGVNKFWIKLFLLTVYATSFIRSHGVPSFYKKLDIEIEDFEMEVFQITAEISQQCFPLTIDLEHKKFLPIMRCLNKLNNKISEAQHQGGIRGYIKKATYISIAGAYFLRLYMIPARKNSA